MLGLAESEELDLKTSWIRVQFYKCLHVGGDKNISSDIPYLFPHL